MNLVIPSIADDLRELMEQPQQLCVSIYASIYPGRNSLQYSLGRFKNLIRQAEELLGANRRNPATALKILSPALSLLNDDQFWQQREQGLAVFLTEGAIYHYHLPLLVEELVVVADHFYVKPLLPLMAQSTTFKRVKKYSATV